MDSAASIRPKEISRMEVSTILAVYGIAAIVRGTIAAVVPMEVPATILVKGMMATIKMMNGMERTILMANASGLLSTGQARIPFFSVTTSRMPSGIPIMAAIMAETESMYNVSARLLKSKLVITGDIA